ncbi:MAG: 2-hydroxy-6-oxo-2,4-heptadienoate hydrolase [Hyphomonas sp. BRH_c22]|uniref:alpha/beta fold hydrolase n=1 Tax=Hyphomonas sp. BRH_c22 TaxID=1629710 RepID=UPI0005F1660D|nr:alpha/beta hydrolase [Hyphomonas sp. BRH_c22]KJS34782.1 MAG: 2-hydroxy-6-oxo-2,4-heptadienoate hydrolase [Hyphomonas sp. BRH_c22]
MAGDNPELGRCIDVNGFQTNYHDVGKGPPVFLIHGSGPGVSAWANWRLNIPELAKHNRVIAPDMLGFGYSARPEDVIYSMKVWVDHCLGVMDTLGIENASIVGNSFGGALALAMAIKAPERVDKLVLMGAVGVNFELTEGLDRAWGYKPSIEAMRGLLNIFAYNSELVSDDLARLRYEASIQPGFQESFSSMFPAPRQKGIRDLASAEADIRAIPHKTLIIHGFEDAVIPVENSFRFLELIGNSQLHVFRKCGHWTQIEHRDTFNALVSGFLSH